jgi:short-subunit dehydrogenase
MAAARPVSLITGASSGIGAALARVFAGHGYEVVLAARRTNELAAVADEVATVGPRVRPHVISIDLAAADAADRLADELAARGCAPQYIVNNAGFGLLGRAATLDRAQQRAMIDLNCGALTDLSLRFIDDLARQRGGILNVASIASFLPGPGMAVYHATKAYVLSFSEGLRRELAPKGIRVTVLCPGPVLTGFQARAGVNGVHYPRGFLRTPDQVARAGHDGLMRGRRVVVPGLQNKIVPWLPRLLPRGMLADRVYAKLRTWDDA